MNSVVEGIRAKGFTFLGIVEGEKIFCNLNSKESIKNCLEFLEKLTGEEWNTFKETTGNKNLVFYKTSMFEAYYGIYLSFKGNKCVELPLNCSSCYYMFKNCVLPEGFSLGDKFDTSNIVDMYSMFYDCIMPEGFSLGNRFDTSSVKDMGSMFYNCIMPEDFSLGDKFDTSRVENMGYMFSDCSMPVGFSLGDKFDITNVMYMRYMFQNCSIPTCFSLGNKFTTFKDKDLYQMFYHCKLPEGKSADDFSSEIEIIEWLKSRGKQGTNKQSAGKLSAF